MTGHLRPATAADARRIAEVHVAGWRVGYRGLLPQAYLDALSVDEREDRWRRNVEGGLGMLVHVGDGGRVDGWSAYGPCRDDDVAGQAGEVFGLYVDPGSWGAGIGAALLTASVSRLPGDRDAPPVLWALEGNRRARGFYERQGWVCDGAVKEDERPALGEVPAITFTEVRYRLPRTG